MNMILFVNIGKYQLGFWPRWKLWFYHPTYAEVNWNIYQHIYKWIVFVWPIELRKFR